MSRRFFETLALTLLCAASAFAVSDPFAGLVGTVQSSAQLWGGALILIGCLIAGGAILFGSQTSGKWLGRFAGGGLLLTLVLKGTGLLSYLQSLFGTQ